MHYYKVIRRVIIILSGLILAGISKAQTGKISGQVIDETNKAVVGASVKISNSKAGAATDVEGRFILVVQGEKKYEIEITAVGFATKNITDIDVIANQVAELQIVLTHQANNLETVTVKTSARKETTNSLIQFQKNTNAVAQVISAEAIRRSPDKNTGEVLKRVTGTSIQEGKYLVVRGLADRYNQAMLNGILLTSTEPDRKTFSYDIFPASMVDNIIINKTFIPEYSGEWAGGLVQINTKDIPASNFFNIQVGTGFNTNTIGHDFYSYKGGKLDWLGFDDGTRALPGNFPTKSQFEPLSVADKNNLGTQIASGKVSVNKISAVPNASFQTSGGFNTKLFKKELGGIISVTYNRSIRRLNYDNSFYSINEMKADANYKYYNDRYSSDVLWGALANFSLKFDANNKINFRNILNVNTSDYLTLRTGIDFESNSVVGEKIRARELGFRANTFFNTQVSGEHNFPSLKSKINWFGSFNILDQYIPQQRRLQYNQAAGDSSAPYLALLSNTLSQKSGSIFFSALSDYIYNAGGDVTHNFNLFGQKQTVKAGYALQIKDRLYDSRPFDVYLPSDNPALKGLNEDQIFAAENFGTANNQFHFDEAGGAGSAASQYRYMANTILNAGYLQLDNSFADWLRVVWGVRYENYDQLIGSTRKSDERFVHSQVADFLPALNITFKVNNKTNIRLAGSQTVVRPEFRELSPVAFYDFEVGATILGNKALKRTKITNLDLRYEIYPRAGELITLGAFFKHFDNPIELSFNQSGAGSSNTFNYVNAKSAKSYGVELEFRKKLDFAQALKNFTLQGNLSYIYNRVKFSNQTLDRPMQGQSPYLINAGLQYDVEKLGLSTTVLFNEIGRRILYVGNDQVPAIWEAPRPLMDLQVAKKIIKSKGEIRLNVSDLLNQRANFYHDLDNSKTYQGNHDALAISRLYGTNVSITFGYTFK